MSPALLFERFYQFMFVHAEKRVRARHGAYHVRSCSRSPVWILPPQNMSGQCPARPYMHD